MARSVNLDNLSNVVLVTELSRQALKWTKLVGMPSFVPWITQYASGILGLIGCFNNYRIFSYKYIFIFIWIVWLSVCVVRGIFSIEVYWDFKNLMNYTPCLIVPLFAIIYGEPANLLSFLRKWNALFICQLILVIIGLIKIENLHFISGIAYYLYGAFWLTIPNKKWKFFILVMLLIMILGDFGARSQMIKGIFAVAICLGFLIKGTFINFCAKIVALSFYPLAIMLLYLGITGQWNFFDHVDHSQDHIITYIDGKIKGKEKDDNPDTRTELYEGVITSAVLNNYIWIGRTPARGNDAEAMFKHMGWNELEPGMRMERNRNEFCHPNVFTWTGMVGLIIYALMYLHATILGLFFSKNNFIVYIGVTVAFNWFFGWIENTNDYNMLNFGLWILIGMCYSQKFRSMSDREFITWFQSIFYDGKLTPYNRIQLIKKLLLLKTIKNKLS